LNTQAQLARNWHSELIAAKLDAVRRGEIKRLIVNVPPRSLKSHSATVAFPAYMLGHDPSAQVICASDGQGLANKRARQTGKNESLGLAISLGPALVADSLCCGQETRMMRKPEIQIETSNSKSSNKFKLRRRL
jgi:hypothetical protein